MKRVGVAMTVVAIGLVMVTASWSGDAPTRPKILGIREVRIYCGESCVGSSFYSKLLPLSGDCWDCNNQTPFLVGTSQEVVLLRSNAKTSDFLAQVTFATDDLAQMERYLVSKGIKTDSEPPYLIVTDPEGHRVAFIKTFRAPHLPRSEKALAWPRRLIHAGWVVKDREAMDKFYRDVLGFHLYWQGGMTDGRVDWVSMQVPDGTDWVEYMLNVPADADKHLLGVMNHIALGVPGVRAAAEELKKNGMKLTEEPKIGRDGKWQLNLYDPDGTRVELMEFVPVEKPCCSGFTGEHPKP